MDKSVSTLSERDSFESVSGKICKHRPVSIRKFLNPGTHFEVGSLVRRGILASMLAKHGVAPAPDESTCEPLIFLQDEAGSFYEPGWWFSARFWESPDIQMIFFLLVVLVVRLSYLKSCFRQVSMS